MKIEQRFAVPFPREQVWAFLRNTEAVARCLPGADLTTGADGHLAGRFSVKLGPIAAVFSGTAEITFDEAAQKGEITGAGSDRKNGSRAKGSVAFALAKENGGTRVDLVVDYALTGALAQFSRGGIIQDLATRLTAQFAGNIKAALGSQTPPPTPAPLDAGNILTRAIWDRLRSWLRSLLGQG